jgi:hypothetical protein
LVEKEGAAALMIHGNGMEVIGQRDLWQFGHLHVQDTHLYIILGWVWSWLSEVIKDLVQSSMKILGLGMATRPPGSDYRQIAQVRTP